MKEGLLAHIPLTQEHLNNEILGGDVREDLIFIGKLLKKGLELNHGNMELDLSTPLAI